MRGWRTEGKTNGRARGNADLNRGRSVQESEWYRGRGVRTWCVAGCFNPWNVPHGVCTVVGTASRARPYGASRESYLMREPCMACAPLPVQFIELGHVTEYLHTLAANRY